MSQDKGDKWTMRIDEDLSLKNFCGTGYRFVEMRETSLETIKKGKDQYI